ncbi:MAG: hypothetical protein WDN46_12475 [Methylocella sp.]
MSAAIHAFPMPKDTTDTVDDLIDRLFDRLNHAEHQISLLRTFAAINDGAGLRRQIKFLTVHVASVDLAIQRISELKNGEMHERSP